MKSKVIELLSFIQHQPVQNFDWGIALVHQLNRGDETIELEDTGTDIMSKVVAKGPKVAEELLFSVFDTTTGQLTEASKTEEVIAPPKPIDRAWRLYNIVAVTFASIVTLITFIVLMLTFLGSRTITAEQSDIIRNGMEVVRDVIVTTKPKEDE